MFKSFVPFQISSDSPFDNPLSINTALEESPLIPCPKAMESTIGIVPVSPSGAMLVSNRTHDVFAIGVESRKISGPHLKRIVNQKCVEFQKQKGYPPGRAVRLQIRSEERQRMMEATTPSYAEHRVWIDRGRNRIIPLVASEKLASDLVAWVADRVAQFSYEPVFEINRIQFKLTQWLTTYEAPEPLKIGESSVLKDPTEQSMQVAYRNSPLSGEDVRIHLQQGKIVDALSLIYEDYKLTLNQKGEVRDVGRLGAKEEEHVDDTEDDDFRTQWCLFTEEMDECIDVLDGAIRS